MSNSKYSQLLKLSNLFKFAKTLYHGTSVDRAQSIAKLGLIPQTGDWVSDCYGCSISLDPNDEDYDGLTEEQKPVFDLIFAADKKTIDKCIGGMQNAVSKFLGKKFHDVSDEDIERYGALVIIRDGHEYFQQRPKSRTKEERKWEYETEGRYPTVESEDYYTEESSPHSYILTGNKMIQVLKRLGKWPREYGPDEIKNKKQLLFQYVLRAHNFKSLEEKQKAKEKINNLNKNDLNRWYNEYRKNYG